MSNALSDDVPDTSSLVDPADFNRDPCDLPAGLKKRHFPDVYPEYADTPSKRSKSTVDQDDNFSSSPDREENESQWGLFHSLNLVSFICWQSSSSSWQNGSRLSKSGGSTNSFSVSTSLSSSPEVAYEQLPLFPLFCDRTIFSLRPGIWQESPACFFRDRKTRNADKVIPLAGKTGQLARSDFEGDRGFTLPKRPGKVRDRAGEIRDRAGEIRDSQGQIRDREPA
jgi:hypothetical protein